MRCTGIYLNDDGPKFNLRSRTTWSIRILQVPLVNKRQILTVQRRRYDTYICPHIKFDDPKIVELIFVGIHPEESLEDPVSVYSRKRCFSNASSDLPVFIILVANLFLPQVEVWIANAEQKDDKGWRRKSCHLCTTRVQVKVDQSYAYLCFDRGLGKGQSAEDPLWLKHCIV